MTIEEEIQEMFDKHQSINPKGILGYQDTANPLNPLVKKKGGANS
jgi:hypothetical protein